MSIARVIDIETTGMEPAKGAEIIEVGWTDLMTDNVDFHRVSSSRRGVKLYRPDRPSPPEVMAVHHILPHELEDQDRFSVPRLVTTMDATTPERPQYLVAHNAEFEQTFLGGLSEALGGVSWLCTYKCALVAWPLAPSHGNQALMYYLGLHESMTEEERHPPHRALPDAVVTAHILFRLLDMMHLEDMVRISSEPANLPTCPIGKERGKRWEDIDSGFLSWCTRQPDMRPDVVHCARKELARRAGR